jgi:uncharacterized cupin superfamily protein
VNALLIEETEDNFSGESVPPSKVVEAGDPRSKTWTAASFTSGRSVSTGIWTAEPGILKVRSYPVDEIFTVLSGKIEVTNEDGSVVCVEPGQSCLLRKGWTGLFHTVEQTRKCFVTVGDSANADQA